MEYSLIYQFSYWANAIFVVFILFAALAIGYWAGCRQQEHWEDADTGGGSVVLSSLLALLGLLLAFTYGASVTRLEDRKDAVVNDANAIGTVFLRADVIPEPGRTELREALLDYARTRTGHQGTLTAEGRSKRLQKSLDAQSKLWSIATRAAQTDTPAPVATWLMSAMNEVLDVHTVRLAAVVDKLPAVVIWMLIFISATSISVLGFNSGLTGRICRYRVMCLALVLTSVILLIVDFDRPSDGLIRVSHRPIDLLIVDMEASLGK